MSRYLMMGALVAVLLTTAVVLAQEEIVIKGTVKEVAADGSYIVVNGQKIFTDAEFLEESFVEVEDDVEIFAEETDTGLWAVDYDFMVEDLDEEEDTVPAAASTQ